MFRMFLLFEESGIPMQLAIIRIIQQKKYNIVWIFSSISMVSHCQILKLQYVELGYGTFLNLTIVKARIWDGSWCLCVHVWLLYSTDVIPYKSLQKWRLFITCTFVSWTQKLTKKSRIDLKFACTFISSNVLPNLSSIFLGGRGISHSVVLLLIVAALNLDSDFLTN